MNKKIKKVGKRASKRYKDIVWILQYAPDDIQEVYGDGYIIRAEKGIYDMEYFILSDDPRTDEWIDMMAYQLQEKIEKDVR